VPQNTYQAPARQLKTPPFVAPRGACCEVGRVWEHQPLSRPGNTFVPRAVPLKREIRAAPRDGRAPVMSGLGGGQRSGNGCRRRPL